jgi:hypothetical protein
MNMSDSLYEGQWVRLAAIEPDRDAEIEARWTHDAEYMRLLSADPVRPTTPAQLKKKYKAAWKDDKPFFHFAIRTRADDRLVGFAKVDQIEWTNGVGALVLGIGDPADRRRGYGRDALRLLLNYAFNELNLHCLMAGMAEYNVGAVRLFEQAGFTIAVRRRAAIHRDGRHWDALILELLCAEWVRQQGAVQ